MHPKIVICSAIRTPIGAIGGTLSPLLAKDLATAAVKASITAALLPVSHVEYVSLGWVMQDPRSPNIARAVADAVGAPTTTPGTTLHENCASGGAAIHDVARRLLLGEITVGIAGGVESMSNVARYLFTGRVKNQLYGDMPLVDGLMGALTDNTVGPKGELMGLLTERLVTKYGVSRQDQDAVAFRSHSNALAAWGDGSFKSYVLPVEVPRRRGETLTVSQDEGPKKLDEAYFTKQKPYFKADGTITGANASSLNDGAAALVLATAEKAKTLNLPVLAELKSFANIGVPKEYMGEGAFKVIPSLLSRAKMETLDVDFWELNEAFAAVTAAGISHCKLPQERVNAWGSGISLGHPVGCTGARQVVDMVHQLKFRGKNVGVTTRCVGGGMGSGEVITLCNA